MRISDLNAKRTSRIDAGVHAGQHQIFLARGEGECALRVFVESGRVLGRGLLDVLLDARHFGSGGKCSAVGGDGVVLEDDGRGREMLSDGELEDGVGGGGQGLLKAMSDEREG